MIDTYDPMERPRRSEYTPVDFHNFRISGSLTLTPKFQRRNVWTLGHRSYFIDSLLRGLPVPPIYLRETQSEDLQRPIREVVDGQQRIHAVLSYMDGDYSISRSVPGPWAGRAFEELSPDQQQTIANFYFPCEVFSGISDRQVLEIFQRLNTYSVQLNRQELRNGRWFGLFKQSAYNLSYQYLEFWRIHRIFTEASIARMLETELTSELLIMDIGGVQDKKTSIDWFYAEFDERFPGRRQAERRFQATMDEINESVGAVLIDSAFRRPPLFYSLFGAVQHRLFGVNNVRRQTPHSGLTSSDRLRLSDTLLRLTAYLAASRDNEPVPSKYQRFVLASLRQTDNLEPRIRRLVTIYDEADL